MARGVRESLEKALGFGASVRRRIYRKLAVLLGNGVRLPDALRVLIQHETADGARRESVVARCLQRWRRMVDNGRTLGFAVAADVPRIDALLIEAGDASGKLPQALLDAVRVQEASGRIRNAIAGGLAYPVVLLLLAAGFLVFYALAIVPAFEQVVPRDRWFGLPAMLASVADWLVAWGPLVAGAIGAALAAAFWSLPRWTGRWRLAVERFPPWSLYRLLQGTSFLLAFAALVQAGMKVPEALRVLGREASPWLAERLRAAGRHVNNGHDIGMALQLAGHGFPSPEIVRDLRTYAGLDGFEENLTRIAREWLEESEQQVRRQMAVVFNASIVIMGLVFAGIASSIMQFQDIVATLF